MREDWIEIELGEICEKAIKVKRNEMPLNQKFIYLDIGGIDNKINQIIEHKTYSWNDAPSRAQQIVKNGDVLFSTVRTYLKNIAQVTKQEYDNQICSSGFTVIRGKKQIAEPKYLYFLSLYDGFLQPLNELQTGTSYPAVRDKDVFGQIIPFAPLPEQRAIVAKIEQLFSELDNGIANLKAAREKLEIYRQAVLKKAFEGELTREWRTQQKDLPTANELLEQIKAEHKAYYQQQLREWQQSVIAWDAQGRKGKKPGKPKKVAELPALSEVALNKMPTLPRNWIYTKQGELIEEPKYGTSKKCSYEVKGKGVLRIPNVDYGKIDSSDLKYAVFSEEEISTYQLLKDDILTIRSNGSVDLVGKCALVTLNDVEYLYAGYLIRLRPYKSLVDSKYLLYCLSSIDLRIQIESKAKSTSGVNNINSGELANLIIPFCTLEEQHQIVQEIETRLSVCDKLAASIDESLEKAEALRQSILKKAFEGKLLSEAELEACRKEADWEPAAQLLERIKKKKVPVQGKLFEV